MIYLNFHKIIALVAGILVFSAITGYMVFAWDEPPLALPWNLDAPINAGPEAQIKSGDLTVTELTTLGGKLYLNEDDSKGGDIERVNYIKAQDGLHLWSSAEDNACLDLDKGEKAIKLSTQAIEGVKIDGNGDMYISGLKNCFLEVNENGKIGCYEGTGAPGDDKFQSTQVEILHIGKNGSDSWTIIDEEGVIKVTAYVSARCSGYWENFKLYINGNLEKQLTANGYAECTWWGFHSCLRWECATDAKSRTWYYHIKQGDVIKLATSGSGSYCSGNASVYNLTFRRDRVEYVFSEEDILYYYDKDTSGEMEKATKQKQFAVPTSIAVTADGIPIIIIVE
ncbi:hypothetical protein KAW43_01690 [Candidatus Parcubacteria bacterium]|nr:hypothetical protein [Candidatus Parcubacteria bacterium]